MTNAQGPDAEFGFNFNEAEFRRQAARAGDLFAEAFVSSMSTVTKDIRDMFAESFGGASTASRVRRESEKMGAAAAQGANSGFASTLKLENTIEKQLGDLQRGVAAQMRTLEGLGLDKDLFAGVDTQIDQAVRSLNDLREAQKAGLDPTQATLWGKRLEAEIGGVRASLREVEPLIRTFISQGDAVRSANTAQMQQDTTLQNAIIRTSSNEQIQSAQSASRARIELARFTFRQIAFIEQQLAKAVRGSIAIVGNIVNGIGTGLGRVGSLFRRTDREMNEGLNGALIQRERALSRSFGRQNATVAQGLAQQSATIQRFERQASRGLAGAVTGRSGLGALVGGGLALGGGYKIAQNLKAGFNEAVNLNEAMNAVNQVFGEAADEVVKFSESSVDVLFQTQSEALKAATSFGVFGKAAGLVGDELSGFTNELVLLGTDLASFYNTTVPEATTAISAALRGESEPIRRFGVLLTEQILQQRAVAEGIIETTRVLQPGERVMAAYAEIIAKTSFVQGDAARTADDFANASRRARAASITTFSALAGAAVPLAEILLKGVNPAMEGLARFIEGNVGPALKTLRAGLIGAAGGLAAMLAARGVLELLQFMAIAIRSIATPMGLLVTAFVALGAAFAIIRERNPAVIVLVEKLRDIVTGGLARGLEFIANTAVTVANVVRTQVLPVFIGLGVMIASRITPLMQKLFDVVRNDVLPALIGVAETIVGVFQDIAPYIAPIVNGFVRLGRAIGSALTGDFSGLLGGLGALGSGIVTSFSMVGDRLIDAILPPLRKAVTFITDFIDQVDWIKVGSAVLQVIETIGQILGRIATHPAFIAALAAVAAAAAIVVATFTKGVIQGIADNIPQWMDIIKEGFSRLSIADVLVGIFALGALGLVISAVIGSFTRIGALGGGSFIKGFAKSVASFPAQVYGGAGGLFGADAVEQAARFGDKQAKSYRKAFDNANRDIRAIGGTPIAVASDQIVGQRGLNAISKANTEFQRLSGTMSEARVRSLLFRDSIGAITNAIKTADVGALGRAIETTVRRTDWGRFGRNAGVGVLAGFGAVMAGQGGFSKGGIMGILTASIGAGLSTNSPLVAAAVGGLGLITAGIQELKGGAEEAAAAIATMAQAWLGLDSLERALALQKTVLDEALKAGTEVQALAALLPADFGSEFAKDATTNSLTAQDAFSRLTSGLQLDTEASSRFLERFQDDLGAVRDAGLIAEQAASGLGINMSEADVNTIVAFNTELTEAGVTAEGFYGILDILTRNAAGATGAISSLGNTASLGAPALNAQAAAAADVVTETKAMTAAQLELNRIDLTNSTKSLFESVKQNVTDAGGSVISLFELIIAEAKRLGISLDLSFLRELTGEVEKAATGWAHLNDEYTHWTQRRPMMDPEAIAEWTEGAAELETEFQDLIKGTNLLEGALDSLNEQRADRINNEIKGLETRLNAAEEAADSAREALTEFITGKYQNTPQALVDDLIGELPGIAESIVEAQNVGGLRGDAMLRSIFGDLDASVADIVQAGFDSGLSAVQITDLFGPLIAAAGETVNPLTAIFDPDNVIVPPETIQSMVDQVQAGADTEQIGIGMQAIFDADGQVRAIQKQLDAKRAELDIEVIFSPDQVAEALRAAGLEQHVLDLIIDPSRITLLQGEGLTSDISEFQASALQIVGALALLGQTPVGADPTAVAPALTQFITAVGVDPASIASGASAGVADASTAAGGGIPTKSVIYRPINVGGSNIPTAV